MFSVGVFTILFHLPESTAGLRGRPGRVRLVPVQQLRHQADVEEKVRESEEGDEDVNTGDAAPHTQDSEDLSIYCTVLKCRALQHRTYQQQVKDEGEGDHESEDHSEHDQLHRLLHPTKTGAGVGL